MLDRKPLPSLVQIVLADVDLEEGVDYFGNLSCPFQS